MRNNCLLSILLLTFIYSSSQEITRGPAIGEIYFMGPTVTVMYDAIYHSTDFGETVVLVDSISALTNTIEAITADKTLGGLYFVTMGEALYYSDNYGQYGSWEFKHGNITSPMRSGITEGFFYKYIASHSENYGGNFISHNLNGFFGSGKDIAIDNIQGTCYCISEVYGVNDTLYLFISYNNFDDLEVKHKFNFHWSNEVFISRDNITGSLFLCNTTLKEVYYSDNFGESWTLKNLFTCPNLPIKGITGGRQDGELYLLVEYLQMMGQRRHVYIYHSLDYGETFTLYHPVSIGPDPIYANFKAEDTLVKPGDTVQFTDLSNDAETWEWDFDNDGTIDSYEQNPTYTYQDTGYYSVKLTITGEVIEDYGIRYDYIHVDDLTSIKNCILQDVFYKVYPNPANNFLTIKANKEITMISIYNSNGELVKSINDKDTTLQESLLTLSTSDFANGIYLIKINTGKESQIRKIIINN